MRRSSTRVEHRADRRAAIPAGTASFLIIGLERAREVIVHDEPNVLLVDAEPERVGCDHDLDADPP